jgi:hypothetical protein
VDWSEVIGKVQEVLTQTEKEAGEREQNLAEIMPPASHEKSAAWKEGLEQFEKRFDQFQARIQQAEEDASEAELVLADGEKTLEHWLARVVDVTRRVAKAQEDSARPDQPTA